MIGSPPYRASMPIRVRGRTLSVLQPAQEPSVSKEVRVCTETGHECPENWRYNACCRQHSVKGKAELTKQQLPNKCRLYLWLLRSQTSRAVGLICHQSFATPSRPLVQMPVISVDSVLSLVLEKDVAFVPSPSLSEGWKQIARSKRQGATFPRNDLSDCYGHHCLWPWSWSARSWWSRMYVLTRGASVFHVAMESTLNAALVNDQAITVYLSKCPRLPLRGDRAAVFWMPSTTQLVSGGWHQSCKSSLRLPS